MGDIMVNFTEKHFIICMCAIVALPFINDM